MEIRPYAATDREACLRLFDGNTPAFFHPLERALFEGFLDSPDCPYFVLEDEGAVYGCGGFWVDALTFEAGLVWGMVRTDLHRKGLGRFLLLYRLREIGKTPGIATVRVSTSQFSAPFFEKQGFRVESTSPDEHAPGFDRVDMVKKMAVCQ